MTCFYVEGTVSFVRRNTEFYGGYSTENDANTAVYDTVSTRVTNHPGERKFIEIWSILRSNIILKTIFLMKLIDTPRSRSWQIDWSIQLIVFTMLLHKKKINYKFIVIFDTKFKRTDFVLRTTTKIYAQSFLNEISVWNKVSQLSGYAMKLEIFNLLKSCQSSNTWINRIVIANDMNH